MIICFHCVPQHACSDHISSNILRPPTKHVQLHSLPIRLHTKVYLFNRAHSGSVDFISPWLCTSHWTNFVVAVLICSAHSAEQLCFLISRAPGSGASPNRFQHSSAHPMGPLCVVPLLLRHHVNKVGVVLPLQPAHSDKPMLCFIFCLTGSGADHTPAW